MKHILIIDDEPLIRYSLSAAFAGRDTEVIAQPDGRNGLKSLGDWQIDICFLDIQLPDADGVELLGVVRQVAPLTKVVMMTASAVEQQAMETIRQNAFLFLAKPFDLFRVKRVIDGIGREERNRFSEFEELEARLAAERRRLRREATVLRELSYMKFAPDKGAREERADLIDVSDAGMRILTACRLEPGSLIQLRSCARSTPAVVRWASVDQLTSHCTAGVQFIAPEELGGTNT